MEFDKNIGSIIIDIYYCDYLLKEQRILIKFCLNVRSTKLNEKNSVIGVIYAFQ